MTDLTEKIIKEADKWQMACQHYYKEGEKAERKRIVKILEGIIKEWSGDGQFVTKGILENLQKAIKRIKAKE